MEEQVGALAAPREFRWIRPHCPAYAGQEIRDDKR